MSWFNVDKRGLAKILARKGKEFVVHELVQNTWDQQVTTVSVRLEPVEGVPKARIFVEDDDPDGFADLAHAYTLFAESNKKSDPSKAGRFNLGEKLVLALCDEATIISTTGGVRFDKDGRHLLRGKRSSGSSFEGVFPCTRDELFAIKVALGRLIPKAGIRTIVNGRPLEARELRKSFEATLPTEVSDGEGNLVRSSRKATVEVFEPLPGEKGALYELGIPVVETGDRWHVNVLQKVPLNMDRDNVPPSFLKKVRVEVLNQMHAFITQEDSNQPWVREASSDKNCSPESINVVLDKRFGEKRVAYDPSDPEANSLAVSKGYVVVHGGMLSGQEWENAKGAGAILPAGRVTPGPKPYASGGRPEDVIPEPEWTNGMRKVAAYTRMLARRLMGVEASIKMTRAGGNFLACYGDEVLTFNLTCLGPSWFDGPVGVEHDRLIIHEFGHQYSRDHLSAEYHEALCLMGAKLAEFILIDPEWFWPFKTLDADLRWEEGMELVNRRRLDEADDWGGDDEKA